MKIFCQNNIKIAIWFDLHDTLVNSKPAWLSAFKECCKNKETFKIVKKQFLSNLWKREICMHNNLSYEEVKTVYLKKLRANNNALKTYIFLKKYYDIYLVSNGLKSRITEDIATLPNLKFKKIYSRECGLKPNINYVNEIVSENNFDFIIMIGNEREKDNFNHDKVKSIIITKHTPFWFIKHKIIRLIKEKNNMKHSYNEIATHIKNETEFKFLVNNVPKQTSITQNITQIYFHIKNSKTILKQIFGNISFKGIATARVRILETNNQTKYIVTLKSGGLFSRKELEKEISQSLAQQLYINNEIARIIKTRYIVMHDEFKFEFDRYLNLNTPLTTVELEVFGGNLSEQYKCITKILTNDFNLKIKDITYDENYQNLNLAKKIL